MTKDGMPDLSDLNLADVEAHLASGIAELKRARVDARFALKNLKSVDAAYQEDLLNDTIHELDAAIGYLTSLHSSRW
jgi:hypothetical protein